MLRDGPHPALQATLPIFFKNGEGEPAATAAPYTLHPPGTSRVLRGYFAGMFREAHPFASSRIQTHENLFKYASSDLRVYVSNASDKA